MSHDENTMRSKIRQFIESNMNVDDDVELQDDDNIFSKGYVSSIFAMRLLTFLENLAGISVADDDIVLPNFSTVDAMIGLINKSRAGAA
ncbi:hypothetical protein V8J88_05765 [Massilia sp. W12]|uniref:hypothetical protein n=1 Tax=Massilia sp. W12 TaxID=3126507 RepID=UPI0030D450B9